MIRQNDDGDNDDDDENDEEGQDKDHEDGMNGDVLDAEEDGGGSRGGGGKRSRVSEKKSSKKARTQQEHNEWRRLKEKEDRQEFGGPDCESYVARIVFERLIRGLERLSAHLSVLSLRSTASVSAMFFGKERSLEALVFESLLAGSVDIFGILFKMSGLVKASELNWNRSEGYSAGGGNLASLSLSNMYLRCMLGCIRIQSCVGALLDRVGVGAERSDCDPSQASRNHFNQVMKATNYIAQLDQDDGGGGRGAQQDARRFVGGTGGGGVKNDYLGAVAWGGTTQLFREARKTLGYSATSSTAMTGTGAGGGESNEIAKFMKSICKLLFNIQDNVKASKQARAGKKNASSGCDTFAAEDLPLAVTLLGEGLFLIRLLCPSVCLRLIIASTGL